MRFGKIHCIWLEFDKRIGSHICFSDFMSQPVMSLLPVEKVGHIYECLTGETFHGFPIIDQDPNVSKRCLDYSKLTVSI